MNTNKSLPFIIGALIIIVAIGVVYAKSSSTNEYTATPDTVSTTDTTTPVDTTVSTPVTTTTTTVSTPKATTPTKKAGEYTIADVSSHNSQSNCWTVVNGGVYNVTSWISQHPGGSRAIIGMCGIDGSDEFNGQHGGARRPASELATFKIGVLVK